MFCKLFGHSLFCKRKTMIMYGAYDFFFKCKRCGAEVAATYRPTSVLDCDFMAQKARNDEVTRIT